MTKAERLAYIKRRFKELDQVSADAILPVSKQAVEEEIQLMESVKEYQKDKRTESDAITSDET